MDKTLSRLLAVFFVSFVLFVIFVVFYQPLTGLTQASEEKVPSAGDSLIFAWPLELPADGEQMSEVTVFVRNIKGRGMVNRTVELSTTLGTVQSPINISDKDGKTLFFVSSDTQGLAEISAVVDNVPVEKTVSIEFK